MEGNERCTYHHQQQQPAALIAQIDFIIIILAEKDGRAARRRQPREISRSGPMQLRLCCGTAVTLVCLWGTTCLEAVSLISLTRAGPLGHYHSINSRRSCLTVGRCSYWAALGANVG